VLVLPEDVCGVFATWVPAKAKKLRGIVSVCGKTDHRNDSQEKKCSDKLASHRDEVVTYRVWYFSHPASRSWSSHLLVRVWVGYTSISFASVLFEDTWEEAILNVDIVHGF